MDTQTQIDRLIELAIVQRTDLKKLVSELPQLREHLSAEIERTFDEFEPQLRTELEEFCATRADDKHAKLSAELGAKIESFSRSLQDSAQAKFSALLKEREENVRVAKEAEAKIAEHAASLPSAVKEIVDAELSRFPRAGEIDQLRKEFQEPRGLNPRGKWQSGEVYNKLDLVAYNGDSFVSNTNGNRERPNRASEEWTLNAARGNSGGGGGIASLTDILPIPSSGQILGSEGPNYTPKTLVAGANITITETPTQITITGDEGQIELQDGTAAAPSLFFVNDVDTGLFRPGTNLIGIAAGGQAAITIGATEMTLNVTDVKLGGDLSIDNDTLFIDKANSRVGIGTSTPEASLAVRSQGSTNTRSILVEHVDNTTAFSQAKFIGARSRGSHGSPSAVLANDSLVSFNGRGYKTSAWSNTVGGFYVYAAENWTNTATGSFAAFRLAATGGTTVSEVARLTSTGNLLVGGTTDISGAGGLKVFGTTSASTSLTGSFLIGNASAATNVGIGGGNINAGGTITSGGNLTAPDLILGTSGPSVRSSLGAKASRQGLVYDGTNWGSIASNAPTLGLTAFTAGAWVLANSLSATQAIIGGENTGSFGLRIQTNGTITAHTTLTGSALTSTGTVIAGKTSLVLYSRDASGTGTFYINGIASGTVSDSRNYSAASDAIGNIFRTVAGSTLGGSISPLIYNRALTAAEVVSLYEAGTPSGADYNNASNTSKLTGANSDFSSAGNWTVAGATTISGGKLNLSDNDQAFCLPGNISIPVGGKFRVTLTVDSITAGAVQVYTGGVGLWVNIATSAGTYTQDFTFSATSGPFTTVNLRCSGGNAVVDTVLHYQIGLLLAPDAQQPGGGTVWYDTSGNSANITLPASGVQWSVPTSGKIGNALAITNTTASTSTTTGSLVLSGGLGVAGAAFVGGNTSIAATSATLVGTPRLRVDAPNTNTGHAIAAIADSSRRGIAIYEAGYTNGTSGSVVSINLTETGGTIFAGQAGATVGGSLLITAGAGVTTSANLTVSGGTVGTAASTNLTLAGGSSGASLVLGQGASGVASTNRSLGVNTTTPDLFSFGSGTYSALNATSGIAYFIANSSTGQNCGLSFGVNGVRQIQMDVEAASGAMRFFQGGASIAERARLTSNLLIGGTTDITGSGGLKVFGTTASTSTTTGALQVAGGVGVAGAAFAGTINARSAAGAVTASNYDYTADYGLASTVGMLIGSNTTSASLRIGTLATDATSDPFVNFLTSGGNNWAIGIDNSNSDSFVISTSSSPGTNDRLTITTGGNATFSGAIAIGNTVNTVSPTSPDRTITIVVGGTTYYIAAKTTND
jgi:hypothetical protein